MAEKMWDGVWQIAADTPTQNVVPHKFVMLLHILRVSYIQNDISLRGKQILKQIIDTYFNYLQCQKKDKCA